jgi:hypothetical protein
MKKMNMLYIRMFSALVLLSAQHLFASDVTSFIITEVMANPSGLTALPETEYIEIQNVSDADISLNGWIFVYDGKDSSLPDSLIKAGQYAVVFREGRQIHVDGDGIAVSVKDFPSALANTGKTIAIKNAKGTVIDETAYPNAAAAVAHERATDASWRLSTDPRGGTPGSVNSNDTESGADNPSPGEIVINEILANPYTGGSEYVEFYNLSGKNLTLGRMAIALRNADGHLQTCYPLSSIKDAIEAGGYIVVSKNREGVLNFYPQAPSESVREANMPVLNNDGGDIVLFDLKDSVVIDEVNYSSLWHESAIKERKGVSLERIVAEDASNDRYNWSSAVMETGYGTPGYKNSQYKTGIFAENFSVNNPEYLYGYDRYEIKYNAEKQGYHCRMNIYSINGTKVAEITSNQTVTSEGVLQWDGKSMDGRKLPSGIYVLHAELFHPQTNDRKTFKRTFLVR